MFTEFIYQQLFFACVYINTYQSLEISKYMVP